MNQLMAGDDLMDGTSAIGALKMEVDLIGVDAVNELKVEPNSWDVSSSGFEQQMSSPLKSSVFDIDLQSSKRSSYETAYAEVSEYTLRMFLQKLLSARVVLTRLPIEILSGLSLNNKLSKKKAFEKNRRIKWRIEDKSFDARLPSSGQSSFKSICVRVSGNLSKKDMERLLSVRVILNRLPIEILSVPLSNNGLSEESSIENRKVKDKKLPKRKYVKSNVSIDRINHLDETDVPLTNCSLCSYKFPDNSRLKNHLKLHVEAGLLKNDPNDNTINLRIKSLRNIVTLFCSTCDIQITDNSIKNCQICQNKVSLKCLKCNDIYEEFETIKTHVKSHSKEILRFKYKCLVCDFATDDDLLYTQHKEDKHNSDNFSRIKICRYCETQFMNTKNLMNHLQFCKKQINNKYQCDHCSYESSMRLNFINHRMTHIPKCNGNVKDVAVLCKSSCPNCNESQLQHSLKPIQNCKKCGAKMLHKCLKCNASFDEYERMICHLSKSPPKKSDLGYVYNFIYFCDVCPYKAYRKNFIDNHKKMHALYEGYFTYVLHYDVIPMNEFSQIINECCSNCNEVKSITSRGDHNCNNCNKQLSYHCNKCNANYVDYKAMYIHAIRRCLPMQEYYCTKCDYRTTRLPYIREHIKRYHLNNTEKPQACSKCPKKFANSTLLQNHLKTCKIDKNSKNRSSKSRNNGNDKQNLEEIDNSTSNNLILAFCQSCNKSMDYLQRKITCKTCNNRYKFQCKLCSLELEKLVNIRRHVKQHNNNFECASCGKKFAKLDNFKMHRQVCLRK